MNMGRPEIREQRFALPLSPADRATSRSSGWEIRSAPCRWTISISTGARMGAEIERIRIFPIAPMCRSSSRVDDHTIDVRFYERGAGETMSSGTGSTGAVAAAMARGMVQQPGAGADAGRASRFAGGRRHLSDWTGRNDCGGRIL